MYKLKFWSFFIIVGVFYAAAVFCPLIYSKHINPALIVPLVTSGVAIVTGVFALIKGPILQSINSPILKISFYPSDKRDCHATSFTDQQSGRKIASVHYFRFRIENIGHEAAEDVEVTVEEVRKYNGRFYEIDTDFMPLRLFWSHWREHRYELAIPSRAYRHCDFGFVIDPTASNFSLPPKEKDDLLFWLDVFIRPNTGRTSLLPGKYQIVISAFGKNAQRSSLSLELEWKGGWYDKIEDLLDKSLVITQGAA